MFSTTNKDAFPQSNKPIQNHDLLQPLVFATIKQRIAFFPRWWSHIWHRQAI
jgi:hypothetical protein